jgi:hypothetical protein
MPVTRPPRGGKRSDVGVERDDRGIGKVETTSPAASPDPRSRRAGRGQHGGERVIDLRATAPAHELDAALVRSSARPAARAGRSTTRRRGRRLGRNAVDPAAVSGNLRSEADIGSRRSAPSRRPAASARELLARPAASR